ncbi:MAG: TMEM165/GDT1 family protein [Candidatus Adiutrix sp.]|jgi:putative Ca2+/H+ antiporter (TMEM165/GDT1 family)|nr:TMEM165/GDT1 family protein [Candidatus Adiutrix sp.]
MDFGVMLPIFTSVFMAELGDKTQVATVCFMAGGGCSKGEVFWASSLALLSSTFLAVVFGAAAGRLIPPSLLKIGAGVIFVIMGLIFLKQALGRRADGPGGGR